MMRRRDEKVILSVLTKVNTHAFQIHMIVESHVHIILQHVEHRSKLIREELVFRAELETTARLHRGIDQSVDPVQN